MLCALGKISRLLEGKSVQETEFLMMMQSAKSDGTIEEDTSQFYLRNNDKAKMRTQIFHLSQKV